MQPKSGTTQVDNMAARRVLVCGGRDFADEEQMDRTLTSLLEPSDVIIHGGARGADTLAHLWAKKHQTPVEVYPADWKLHGKSAGHIRNAHMLATGIDLVIAFDGGPGTTNMVTIARRSNVEVYEVPTTSPESAL